MYPEVRMRVFAPDQALTVTPSSGSALPLYVALVLLAVIGLAVVLYRYRHTAV